MAIIYGQYNSRDLILLEKYQPKLEQGSIFHLLHRQRLTSRLTLFDEGNRTFHVWPVG